MGEGRRENAGDPQAVVSASARPGRARIASVALKVRVTEWDIAPASSRHREPSPFTRPNGVKNQEGLENFDEILEVTDGVMVSECASVPMIYISLLRSCVPALRVVPVRGAAAGVSEWTDVEGDCS